MYKSLSPQAHMEIHTYMVKRTNYILERQLYKAKYTLFLKVSICFPYVVNGSVYSEDHQSKKFKTNVCFYGCIKWQNQLS